MNAILKPTLHPDEHKARIELAACYRVFAMLGWTEMIYNHITVRAARQRHGRRRSSS